MVVTAQVWQPTVLTTEFVGPLTVAEPGQAPFATATWQHAQTQVHGLPISPESVTISLQQPVVDRTGGTENIFKADRLDLDGRLVSGTVRDNPVIEIVLKLIVGLGAVLASGGGDPARRRHHRGAARA